MTDLGPALAGLLDDARSEAKRRGNGAATPLHLAVAVQRAYPQAAETGLGADLLATVESRISELPLVFESPEADADVIRILDEAVPRANQVDAVCEALRVWLSAPTPSPASPATAPATTPAPTTPAPAPATAETAEQTTPKAPTAPDVPPAAGGAAAVTAPAPPAAFSLPARWAKTATVVAPRPDLLPRASVVDAVLSLTGSRSPVLPVVVGPAGAGRSAVAECLAQRLADPAYSGPLAGSPVVLVHAEDVISAGRAQLLSEIVQSCEGKAVVVLDDVEVLLALGSSGGLDLGMLVLLRSFEDDPDCHVVATLDADFRDRFEAADRELAHEVGFVDLPVLDGADVRRVADQAAQSLGGYHRVAIPPAVVEAACAPATQRDTAQHPGLAVARLDRAATTASLRGAHEVTVDDLPSTGPAAEHTFDPVQALVTLSTEIIGQEDALNRVVDRLAITRAAIDLRPERPDGVFLFAGPTGTGKTATALALAKAVYGDASALLRLDMSEYVESHSVSLLVGSPPGYVGSTEPEDWLTTKVRDRPESVLLLDEIEKAHPLVWNTFLQVFDAGRLTDRQGRTADFSRTIVVMTSNVGSSAFAADTGPGFGNSLPSVAADEAAVLRAVKSTMAPELVNRLDDVLVFHPLTPEAVHTITKRLLDQAAERMRVRGWDVNVDPSAVDLVARHGFSREYGARPLQREIETRFLQPLVKHAHGAYKAYAVDDDTMGFEPAP